MSGIDVFEAARRLASAYSHEWGGMSADDLRAIVEGVGNAPGAPMAVVQAIDAWTCEEPASALGRGESCPTLSVGPSGWALVHTTQTGRTSWRVTDRVDHAIVDVEISRPAGICLRAGITLSADGSVHVTYWQRSDPGDDPERVPAERHIGALVSAVEALLPRPTEWSAEADEARLRVAEGMLRGAVPGSICGPDVTLLDAWRAQVDALALARGMAEDEGARYLGDQAVEIEVRS